MSKVVFPRPPPTTNVLNAQQRSQLVRSTKKVERVLGATPLVLDYEDYPRLLGYSDMALEIPPGRRSSDSLSSDDSSSSSKHPVLHLEVSYDPELRSNDSAFDLHSYLPHEDENTPSFSIPSKNTLRRQKMERLRRKLGDGVPMELVFRADAERECPSRPVSKPSSFKIKRKAVPQLIHSPSRNESKKYRLSLIVEETDSCETWDSISWIKDHES